MGLEGVDILYPLQKASESGGKAISGGVNPLLLSAGFLGEPGFLSQTL
jgi:hypothetical protein